MDVPEDLLIVNIRNSPGVPHESPMSPPGGPQEAPGGPQESPRSPQEFPQGARKGNHSMKKITYLKTFGFTKQQNVTYSLLFFEPNYCMHYFIFLSNTQELCSDCYFFFNHWSRSHLPTFIFHHISIFFYSNMPSTCFASSWIASWETRLKILLVLHCGNSWIGQ